MEEHLLDLLNNSYSPYSKFKVSAIVVMKDGKSFNGVNVENASYGATICAERNAIFTAISNGYHKNDFHAIYIMVNSLKIATPCLMCRQVMVEFFDDDTKIICLNNKKESKEYSMKELCPYSFNEDNLK